MYRAADPEVLLWPCPDFWYAMVKYWGSNHVLLNESPRLKAIFVAGHAETTFDMTQPVVANDPWRFFEDGETVDLDALKAKRLINKNAGRIKVLARGTMTKSLTVAASKFSLQAVKMITLAGGIAEIED